MENRLNAMINWDESWSIGIAEIDDEHQQLVKLIQKLFGALISAQAADHIREIFHELIDYTHYHFENEEKVMQEYHFPDLSNHKLKHQELIKQVLDVSDRILMEGESEQLGDDIFEFLKQWLVNHIIKEDLKFKGFIQTRQ